MQQMVPPVYIYAAWPGILILHNPLFLITHDYHYLFMEDMNIINSNNSWNMKAVQASEI